MIIEVKGLKKSFGEKEVLKGLSFTAESGTAYGLLGRNGAGKTTAIRILMGVFYPDEGEILVDGKPIDRNKLKIGYLPEERGLYPKKKIREQLIYFGVLRGLDRKKAAENTVRWLERMGMSEYADRPLETLSKGNQQKIQLAATLLCDPQLIILDEPFSGLDPVNAGLLRDVIREMIDGGSAVIFSSHQMNYIEEFCDNITILNGGVSSITGSIREIKRSYPRNIVIIGTKEAEKIAGIVIKNGADIIESAESGEYDVTVRLKSEDDKAKLMKIISESGADIDSFLVKEPTLGEIFVDHAGGGV